MKANFILVYLTDKKKIDYNYDSALPLVMIIDSHDYLLQFSMIFQRENNAIIVYII